MHISCLSTRLPEAGAAQAEARLIVTAAQKLLLSRPSRIDVFAVRFLFALYFLLFSYIMIIIIVIVVIVSFSCAFWFACFFP